MIKVRSRASMLILALMMSASMGTAASVPAIASEKEAPLSDFSYAADDDDGGVARGGTKVTDDDDDDGGVARGGTKVTDDDDDGGAATMTGGSDDDDDGGVATMTGGSDDDDGGVATMDGGSSSSGSVSVGTTFTSSGISYQITAKDEVAIVGRTRTVINFYVPARISRSGKSFKVTSIGKKAFRNYSAIRSVSGGQYLTSIDDYAFSGCASLKTVSIGDKVTKVGISAFSSCPSLTTVTIGKNVEKLRKRAFYKDTKLATIVFRGDKLNSTGTQVIKGISASAKITIPKGMTTTYRELLEIGENAGITLVER